MGGLRKKLIKLVLSLFVLYQILNPLSYFGLVDIVKADYLWSITTSQTISGDNTADYIWLTGENQIVENQNGQLLLTNTIDWQRSILLEGSGDWLKVRNDWQIIATGGNILVTWNTNYVEIQTGVIVTNNFEVSNLNLLWNAHVNAVNIKVNNLYVTWEDNSLDIDYVLWNSGQIVLPNGNLMYNFNQFSYTDQSGNVLSNWVSLQSWDKIIINFSGAINLQWTGFIVESDEKSVDVMTESEDGFESSYTWFIITWDIAEINISDLPTGKNYRIWITEKLAYQQNGSFVVIEIRYPSLDFSVVEAESENEPQNTNIISTWWLITWNVTVEYVLLTGQNKILEIATGASLEATGSVPGYVVSEGIYMPMTWSVVIDGFNNKLIVDENAKINIPYNSILVISGLDNEIIFNSWYYSNPWIGFFGSWISFKVFRVIPTHEFIVQSYSNVSLQYENIQKDSWWNVYVWKNAKVTLNIKNSTISYLKSITVWTGSQFYFNYIGVNWTWDTVNVWVKIFAWPDAKVVINGVDYTTWLIECNKIYNEYECNYNWPYVLLVKNWNIIAGLNELEITNAWSYNFIPQEGKFNIVKSYYTGSDVVVNMDVSNLSKSMVSIFDLSGENKANINTDFLSIPYGYGVSVVNKYNNLFVFRNSWYSHINYLFNFDTWILEWDYWHICNGSFNGKYLDILGDWMWYKDCWYTINRQINVDEIYFDNEGELNQYQISSLKNNTKIVFSTGWIHWLNLIDGLYKVVYSWWNIYIYKWTNIWTWSKTYNIGSSWITINMDFTWLTLIDSGNTNIIYYCDNQFTFNSWDCVPPTPIFYGSWSFQLIEYTWNNHKLILTDIRPEILKVGEIKCLSDECHLTWFNLLKINWDGEDQNILLTWNWNLTSGEVLSIYVEFGNYNQTLPEGIIYKVDTLTGDSKFISHEVWPFVWWPSDELGVNVGQINIPVYSNTGLKLSPVNISTLIEIERHYELFDNVYDFITSWNVIKSVFWTGQIVYHFNKDYWFNFGSDSVEKLNEFTGDIDTVSYLVDWDTVEVNSQVPVKCFENGSSDLSNAFLLCNLLNSDFKTWKIFLPYNQYSWSKLYFEIWSGKFINGENYINGDQIIGAVNVQSLKTGYNVANINKLDTNSYSKVDISFKVDTDADDKNSFFNNLPESGKFGIKVETGDLNVTYIVDNLTGDYNIFKGNIVVYAPVVNGICPVGFSLTNWEVQPDKQYCEKQISDIEDSDVIEVYYQTKKYINLKFKVSDGSKDFTGYYYKIVTYEGGEVYSGITNDVLVDLGQLVAWKHLDYIEVYADWLSGYRLAGDKYVTYTGKELDYIWNWWDKYLTGLRIDFSLENSLNYSGTFIVYVTGAYINGKIILTGGNLSDYIDDIKYVWIKSFAWYKQVDVVNGVFTGLYVKYKYWRPIYIGVTWNNIVKWDNENDKFTYAKLKLWVFEYTWDSLVYLNQNYEVNKLYQNKEIVITLKYPNHSVFTVDIPLNTGYSIEVENSNGTGDFIWYNNYFVLKDVSSPSEEQWTVRIIITNPNVVGNYICWGDWQTQETSNALICYKNINFVQGDNVIHLPLKLVEKTNAVTLKAFYINENNPVVFTGILSGVNNSKVYISEGTWIVSFEWVETGDYVLKYEFGRMSAHNVTHALFEGKQMLNYVPEGYLLTGQRGDKAVLMKNISFTWQYTDEVIIPKLYWLNINITWNQVSWATVKLYIPENVDVVSWNVSKWWNIIDLDYEGKLSFIIPSSNFTKAIGKIVIQKQWLDCSIYDWWFINQDWYCERDFDLVNSYHLYVNVAFNQNTLTFTWTWDSKCGKWLSIQIYPEGHKYDWWTYKYLRKEITGDVNFQVSTSLVADDYEYTIWLDRCGSLTGQISLTWDKTVNISVDPGKWIKVVWKENYLTGEENNNIFVDLVPVDDNNERQDVKWADENGYIVKINDKSYNVVVRDRFNRGEKQILGIYSGDTRLDNTTTWQVDFSPVNPGTILTIVFKEGYTIEWVSNIKNWRISLYKSWTNDYVAGARINYGKFVLVWIPEGEYILEAYPRRWDYENFETWLVVNSDISNFVINFKQANVTVDMSFDKDFVMPWKYVKLKINPNANPTGSLSVDNFDQLVDSANYYIWSWDSLVSSWNITSATKTFNDVANKTITVKFKLKENISANNEWFKVTFNSVELQLPIQRLELEVPPTAKPNEDVAIRIKAPKWDVVNVLVNGQIYTGVTVQNWVKDVNVKFVSEWTWIVQIRDITNNVASPVKLVVVKSDVPVLKSYIVKVNGFTRVEDDLDDGVLKVKYFNVWAHPDLKIADKIEVNTTFDGSPDSVGYILADIESTNWVFEPETIEGYGIKDLVVKFTKDGKEYYQTIAKVVILIDPSGKVINKVTKKPVPNVKATLYQLVDKNWQPVISTGGVDLTKLANYLKNGYTPEELVNDLTVCQPGGDAYPCSWQVWDGTFSDQVNPQYTDENGKYGWDVPEWYYYVAFEDIDDETNWEFESFNSYVVHIPPAVTDLDQYIVTNDVPEFVKNIKVSDIVSNISITSSLTENRLLVDGSGQIMIYFPAWLALSGISNVTISQPQKENLSSISVNGKNVEVKIAIEIPTSTGVVFSTGVKLCAKETVSDLSDYKVYYSTGISWIYDESATNTLATEGDYICFITNHFTKFVIGKEKSSSSSNWSSWSSGGTSSGGSSGSSSSWWWGWWGWGGWYYYGGWWGGWWWGGYWSVSRVEKKVNRNSTTKRFIKVTISNYKAKLNSIKFKTPKFKKIVPVLNKLVEEKVIDVARLIDVKVANRLASGYYEFVKKLAEYEQHKITKKELKSILAKFLKDYKSFKNQFNQVVRVEKIDLQGIKVSLWKVRFKNKKIEKLVDRLDGIIVKYLSKKHLAKEKLKRFVELYNKFKLAVKYMKEKNKTKGKRVAKEYLKEMLKLLK